MDFAPKSMAAGAASNVDINTEMDEVLKRIQVPTVQGECTVTDYMYSKQCKTCCLFIFVCYKGSKNVSGVMVINNEGIPLKSTLDSSTTVQVSISVRIIIQLLDAIMQM